MIPGYNLIKQLGRGGCGDVYLAEAKDTRQQVAIKFLRDFDRDSLQRFKREVRLLYEHIDNQFIVDVFGYSLGASPPYIIMEYCVGGSLRQWVTKQCEWKTVALALAYAVQGLTGIHRAGGVHRDIKPDNLLLQKRNDGKWIVKVADFGLARVPVTLTGPMTMSAMGTVGYMAPELLTGGMYTQAADIYSLGVTGRELLIGDKSTPLPQSGETPIELTALLMLMTSFNMLERPDMQSISRYLYYVLNSEPYVSPIVRAQPRPSLSWRELALGGLALLGLLAAGDDRQ